MLRSHHASLLYHRDTSMVCITHRSTSANHSMPAHSCNTVFAEAPLCTPRRRLFASQAQGAPQMPTSPARGNIAARQESVSASELAAAMQRSSAAAPRQSTNQPAAKAEGTVVVWRVENFEAVRVAETDAGSFYAGDSYVVKHSVVRGTAVVDTYYIWQGSRSTTDEKGAAVLLAKDMAGVKGGGRSPLIRVVMGKEPDYFLSLFGGSMVVLQA